MPENDVDFAQFIVEVSVHASKNVGFEYDDLERTSDGTIKKGLGWNTLMLASLNQRYGE